MIIGAVFTDVCRDDPREMISGCMRQALAWMNDHDHHVLEYSIIPQTTVVVVEGRLWYTHTISVTAETTPDDGGLTLEEMIREIGAASDVS